MSANMQYFLQDGGTEDTIGFSPRRFTTLHNSFAPQLKMFIVCPDWVSSCVDQRLTFLRRLGTHRRAVPIFYSTSAPAGLHSLQNSFLTFFL